jgi:hypothetical protein
MNYFQLDTFFSVRNYSKLKAEIFKPKLHLRVYRTVLAQVYYSYVSYVSGQCHSISCPLELISIN